VTGTRSRPDQKYVLRDRVRGTGYSLTATTRSGTASIVAVFLKALAFVAIQALRFEWRTVSLLPLLMPRLLASLQPLLMLLVLALAPGLEQARAPQRVLLVQAEAVAKGALGPARAESGRDLPASLTRVDGDEPGPEPSVAPPQGTGLLVDYRERLRVRSAAWSTAPPTHRPCSAPPTGPPSLA
jgi:hypothetical protein